MMSETKRRQLIAGASAMLVLQASPLSAATAPMHFTNRERR
jgi:hypothetical protein